MMNQILQIVGALLVLAGFAASQLRWLDTKSLRYLIVNALGSGLLAVLALLGRDWGFLLLEGAWAVVSLISLGQVATQRTRRSPR